MLTFLQRMMNTSSHEAGIIVSIALMLFLGFVGSRITNLLRLPNVTAYILIGILIGPYCLNLIPLYVVEGTGFLVDVALAFIAFSVGEFFRFSILKRSGIKIVVITLFEACMASLAVFVLTYLILNLNLAFSIVLAALASATAPASTIMTIRQTRARGDFVDTLLQAVSLDDMVSLILYSIAISVAVSTLSSDSVTMSVGTIMLPVLINIGVLLLGGGFGFLLWLLMKKKHSTDNRLIIVVSLLFAFCGICTTLDVSPLLGCMFMGLIYVNLAEDVKLFKQVNDFSPPILLLFFVRSGLSFKLDTLLTGSNTIGNVSLLKIGVLYFFVRIIGKYVGAWLGCLIVKKPKEVRNYLGLALIPQAGVAIGLSALCARTIGGTVGSDMQTIILASSVLYELVGPGCAKLSLYLSKSYSNKLEDVTENQDIDLMGQAPPPVEVLIQRISQIQEEMRKDNPQAMYKEEQAFVQAAEEQVAAIGFARLGPIRNPKIGRQI